MTPRRSLDVTGIDPRLTLWAFGVFRSDPTHRWGPGWFARAVLTPAGSGTVRYSWTPEARLEVEAWGDGADWLLEAAPRWLGVDDDPSGLDTSGHRHLHDLRRRHAGLRLGGSGVIWQELAFAVLGQRVTTEEASGSWRRITERWGEPAPGPCELLLPVRPEVMAERTYVELHAADIDRHRAETLVRAARRAARLEEAATMTAEDALRRLTAVSGLGPWTATTAASTSHAHADLVILRDFGLPTLVSYVLTGDGRHVPPGPDGDARMMELLAPFAGHRGRVLRLLLVSGVTAPRRAPRPGNPRISRL